METFYKTYPLKIVLPSLLAIILFATTLFGYIVPEFEESALVKKKVMIKNLIESSFHILTFYETQARQGKITEHEAQEAAKEIVRGLRYGAEGKDYFWISDTRPYMIMHPYRPDLEQKDVANFKDSNGLYLFREFVHIAEKEKAGYVRYMWQWKDDSAHIAPKLSYIKLFEPWNWIIGSGVYLEDIKKETRFIIQKISLIAVAVLFLVFLLNFWIIHNAAVLEKKRRSAEKKLFAHLGKLDLLVSQRTTELAASEERFRDLIDNAHDLIQSIRPDGSFEYVNRAWYETLGYSEGEIKDLNIFNMIAPEAKEHCLLSFQRVMAGEDLTKVEVVLLTKTGEHIIMEGKVSCKQVKGEPLFTRGIFRDITERKKAEIKINQQNRFLNHVIESIPFPFSVINLADYSIALANSRVATGLSWMGKKCHLLSHHGRETPCCGDDGHMCPIEIVKKTKSSVTVEHIHFDNEGNKQYVEVHGYPIINSSGEVYQMIEAVVDITKRKLLEQKMEKESVTDELTGLLNRRGFFSFAEKQLKIAIREKHDIFLLYADLDNMKQINDTLGHELGDKALIETAEVLRSTFRNSDIYARIGGDEFIVLMISDTERDSKDSITRRLQQHIEVNNQQADRAFDLSISTGVALFDHNNPAELEEMIKEADALMYSAKQAKKTEKT